MLEDTKASPRGHVRRNPAVYSFGWSVADRARKPGQDPYDSSPQHPYHLSDWLKSAAERLGIQRVKEGAVAQRMSLLQEATEQLLQTPETTGRQRHLLQCFELFLLIFAQTLRIEEQGLTQAFLPIVTFLLQLAGFGTTNFVDGLIQVFREMKVILHDSSIRDALFVARFLALLHIHADGCDPTSRLLGQRFLQLIG